MKICSKCKLPKELNGFDKKGKGYSSHCKECRKDYVKDHYSRHKAYYIEKAARSNQVSLLKYQEFKRTLVCTDCGFSFKEEPYLCDFHHLVPTAKDFNPSSLRTFSWNTLQKELKKCVPLCVMCHRRRHYKGI